MVCRSCGAPLGAPFLDLGLQPHGPELVPVGADRDTDKLAELRLSACDRCGLIQLDAPLRDDGGMGHGHAASVSTALAEHEQSWARRLASGLARSSAPAGTAGRRRILDVACGDGNLLSEIAAVTGAPNDSVGFEPDPAMAARARARGLNVPAGHFDGRSAERLFAEGWTADLVVVNHALAHTDDPVGMLRAIRTVLAPNGLVAIEAHHVVGLVRDGQFDVASAAHASYPSMSDLLSWLAAVDLNVIEADRVEAYGGALRVLVMPGDAAFTAPGDVDAALGRILSVEMAALVGATAPLAALAARARQVAGDLRDYLVARAAEGARVAGYGAPARAGTLLNLAGIDATLLPFTVDRNPAKHGLAMAGSRIPVLEPAALEAAPLDDVLVLPWTLVDEIGAQLGPLRSRGTRLVVAMPELRVLTA